MYPNRLRGLLARLLFDGRPAAGYTPTCPTLPTLPWHQRENCEVA